MSRVRGVRARPRRPGEELPVPAEGPNAIAAALASVAERAGVDLSREIWERLGTHVRLLAEWQPVQNLVAPATLPAVWTRHVLDSAQVIAVRPQACRYVDLGSGAGFPGLVVASLLAGRPGTRVHLVESNLRKVAFLREVSRTAGLPVTVHPRRIEDALPPLVGEVEVVSARAVADLSRLLAWSGPLLEAGAVAVFHKGLRHDEEAAAAVSHGTVFDMVVHDSVTDRDGRLLEIRSPVAPGRDGTEE